MIDCATSQGCNGGFITDVLQYCVKNGIDSEASYPYTGRAGDKYSGIKKGGRDGEKIITRFLTSG